MKSILLVKISGNGSKVDYWAIGNKYAMTYNGIIWRLYYEDRGRYLFYIMGELMYSTYFQFQVHQPRSACSESHHHAPIREVIFPPLRLMPVHVKDLGIFPETDPFIPIRMPLEVILDYPYCCIVPGMAHVVRVG